MNRLRHKGINPPEISCQDMSKASLSGGNTMNKVCVLILSCILFSLAGCSKQQCELRSDNLGGSTPVCNSCRSHDIMHTFCREIGDSKCSGFHCSDCGSKNISFRKTQRCYLISGYHEIQCLNNPSHNSTRKGTNPNYYKHSRCREWYGDNGCDGYTCSFCPRNNNRNVRVVTHPDRKPKDY